MLYYSEGVIYLAEFCKCGSLVMNGRCTNKSCTAEGQNKAGVTGMPSKKTRSVAKKSPTKTVNPRRASKCITYNLYEDNNEEEKDTSE